MLIYQSFGAETQLVRFISHSPLFVAFNALHAVPSLYVRMAMSFKVRGTKVSPKVSQTILLLLLFWTFRTHV